MVWNSGIMNRRKTSEGNSASSKDPGRGKKKKEKEKTRKKSDLCILKIQRKAKKLISSNEESRPFSMAVAIHSTQQI